MSFSVIGTPEAVFARGESDHAPTALSFGRSVRSSASAPPIPSWITKHLNFKVHVSSLVECVDIFSLQPSDQLKAYNSCLKEAARRVRNESFFANPDGSEEKKLVLSSVSRALWFNNLGLARKLIDYSASAKDLIYIEDSTVKAFSFQSFETIFGDFFNTYHSSQVQQIQIQMTNATSVMLKKQLKSRLQCARRMLSIFWKTGGRLKLAGIKARDSEGNTSIVTGPTQVQSALSEHWSPIYSKKNCSTVAANALLCDYGLRNAEKISKFAACRLPNKDRFSTIIKKVKDSATGPNGIPYSAYAACTDTSAQVLENTVELFGEEPEPGQCKADCYDFLTFNRQLVWFAPKGELAEDSVVVHRTPDNLRTIFGSNADAKLISAGISDSIVEATLELTPAAQRGFCRGRQLSLNVVDLDTFSRAFNTCANIDLTEEHRDQQYKGSISDLPAVMLYDFCNAFPTVLHEWMWLVLTIIKLLKNILQAIRCLYLSIRAFSAGCGDGTFLFNVLAGVKTGCPLSSILFLLCVNPFIELVIRNCDVPKLAVTRICADDFGSALRYLLVLKTQARVFLLAARCAGLHLKPSKCVLIITACNLTEDLVSAIRAWLIVNVPEFADIIISNSGKFLGWHLGRQGAVLSFAAPVQKFSNRVHEIVAGKAPAAPSIIRYNQRCPTVLSYVAQFAEPPCEYNIESLAHWACHSILRLPPKSFSRKLINSVAFCSGINPLPIVSYCAAVRYRFAVSEASYLIQLREDFFAFVGDNNL